MDTGGSGSSSRCRYSTGIDGGGGAGAEQSHNFLCSGFRSNERLKVLNFSILLVSFRTARVGVSQRSGRDMVSAQRGVWRRQRHQLAANRRDQNCQVRHCPLGRPQHLRLHAVHLPNGLHSGESQSSRYTPFVGSKVQIELKRACRRSCADSERNRKGLESASASTVRSPNFPWSLPEYQRQ